MSIHLHQQIETLSSDLAVCQQHREQLQCTLEITEKQLDRQTKLRLARCETEKSLRGEGEALLHALARSIDYGSDLYNQLLSHAKEDGELRGSAGTVN